MAEEISSSESLSEGMSFSNTITSDVQSCTSICTSYSLLASITNTNDHIDKSSNLKTNFNQGPEENHSKNQVLPVFLSQTWKDPKIENFTKLDHPWHPD